MIQYANVKNHLTIVVIILDCDKVVTISTVVTYSVLVYIYTDIIESICYSSLKNLLFYNKP